MQLFQSLRQRRSARAAAPLDEYADLLAQITSGETIKDGHAEAVLEANDKSVEDLEADLARYKRRVELANIVDKLPERQSVLDDVEAEIELNNAEFNKARQAFAQRADELSTRRVDASCLVNQCRGVAHDLRKWQPEWIAAAIADAKSELPPLISRLAETRQLIASFEEDLRTARSSGARNADEAATHAEDRLATLYEAEDRSSSLHKTLKDRIEKLEALGTHPWPSPRDAEIAAVG